MQQLQKGIFFQIWPYLNSYMNQLFFFLSDIFKLRFFLRQPELSVLSFGFISKSDIVYVKFFEWRRELSEAIALLADRRLFK